MVRETFLHVKVLNSTSPPSSSCHSFQEDDALREEAVKLSNAKRHSEGTFSNDYSKYLEDRKAQDFVRWLMNNKRSGWVSGEGTQGLRTKPSEREEDSCPLLEAHQKRHLFCRAHNLIIAIIFLNRCDRKWAGIFWFHVFKNE